MITLSLNKEYNKLVFTYLTFWENDDKTEYICGVLSVDIQGFPIEYRFSEKIILDEQQKIFYGTALKKYIVTKVIGEQIISVLDSAPDFIIVEEEELLAIRGSTKIPVLLFESTNTDELSYDGLDDHIELYEKIPTTLITMNQVEPFLRLKEAINYSLTLQDGS
jgi:hypothetical protein